MTKLFTLLNVCLFVLLPISGCSTASKVDKRVVSHFDSTKYRAYSFSEVDDSNSKVDNSKTYFGEGSVGDDAEQRDYKYIISFDKNRTPVGVTFGASGTNGGEVVFLTIDETKDKLRKCSRDNAGNSTSALFQCMDAVMAVAAADCDNARNSDGDVAGQCWWE